MSNEASRGSQTTNLNRNPYLQTRGHVAALDGLRGIAILMVLFHHTWPYVWSNPAYAAISTFKHIGWIGVDLFFVLSGFLITGILLESRNQPGYLKNFIARRSLRVFPLYYFFLMLSFTVVPALLILLRPELSADQLYSTHQGWFALYISNYLPFLSDPIVAEWLHPGSVSQIGNSAPDFLTVTWSLCVEEQFYLLWPVLILAFRKAPTHLILLLIASVIICRTLVVHHLDHWQQVSYMTTFCRGDSLLIGAALATCSRCVACDRRVWIRLSKFASCLLLPGAVIWIIKSGGRGDPNFASFGYTIVAAGFAGWVGIAITHQAGIVNSILSNRSLRWFGKYSYGLYLYHMIVVATFQAWRPAEMTARGTAVDSKAFEPIGGSILLDAPIRTILVVGTSMLLAWLSFHLLESHFLRLKRFFSNQPKATTTSNDRCLAPTATAPNLSSL